MEADQPRAGDATQKRRVIGADWVKISVPQAKKTVNRLAEANGWVGVQPNWENPNEEFVFAENRPDARPVMVILLMTECAWVDPKYLPKDE